MERITQRHGLIRRIRNISIMDLKEMLKLEDKSKIKNTSSSPGEIKPSSSPKLRDLMITLQMEGRVYEAFEVGSLYPMALEALHGLKVDQVLDMTVDEFCSWLKLPPKPAGYSNFVFGEAQFNG